MILNFNSMSKNQVPVIYYKYRINNFLILLLALQKKKPTLK